MRVTIIGGSGFVGNALTTTLSDLNHEIILLSRSSVARDLSSRVKVKVYKPQHFSAELLSDCDCVINLVGILNKRIFHPQDFHDAHVELVRQIIHACRSAGIRRYLHVGALNADPQGPSEYLKTKYAGEKLVLEADDLDATSFRPSVIFGREDSFLNRFARLLKLLPAPIFPLACADTLFAPVYVNELATRIVESMDNDKTIGQCINLCGPKQYTLEQIVSYVAQLLGKRVKIIALPDSLAKLQARFCDFVPGRPFSFDNYLSLQVDSICDADETLCDTPMEDIAPNYIK